MNDAASSERNVVVFLIAFVAVYVGLYVGYMAIPDDMLRDKIYPWSIVKPVVASINLLDAGAAVADISSTVVSNRGNLEIVRGCDGSGVILLLTAAIVAFPARWRSKAAGIGWALLFVALVNHLRLVGLYFVQAHANEWFVPLHVYVFPTLLVLLGGVYFIAWASGWGSSLERRGRAT